MSTVTQPVAPEENKETEPVDFATMIKSQLAARASREEISQRIAGQSSITGLAGILAEILLDIREDIQTGMLAAVAEHELRGDFLSRQI